MSESNRYLKVIYWSDEDQCFIGAAPGLLYGGACHGDDERAVFNELVGIIEEWIEIMKGRGEELPPPTVGRVSELLAAGQVAAE